MHTNTFLAMAAALVAIVFSSCIYDDFGPPYSSYGNAPPPGGYAHVRPSYGVSSSRLIHRGYGYGYGHHRDDHRYHSHKEEKIKLTGGSQKGKGTRPKEYHTREWFEKKGYNLDNYKHKHEHSGVEHKGANYGKSKSKSKSKSSGKKKKKKKD